ncbi:MAG: DNA recombination protein RmuC [Candidatus Zixiibacteriota bacterium]|nr:MAG: DNA recombination protein RmuC [candidate division Zixibacteria bacterium]
MRKRSSYIFPNEGAMIDWLTILIALFCLTNVAVIIWLVRLMRKGSRDADAPSLHSSIELLKAELISKQAESLLALRNSIDTANQIINERLAESSSSLDKRMAVFGEIENQLGQLSQKADSIESVGRNIQSLSELLRPPQARGKVGEILLENLLSQILPRSLYETQYRFSDGTRVDAVIKLGDRLLPVDAKFPMEAWQRLMTQPDDTGLQKEFVQTLKRHLDAIGSKYIKPDKNTTDFAVMYIPAEAVYYQLVAGEDATGFDYALSKNVIPSSPGHLYGFLASVSAIYSGLNLAQASLARGEKWLADGLADMTEVSRRLERIQERMEGSLRALSAGLEKSRGELGQIQLHLERLQHPVASPSEKSETDVAD